MQGEELRALRKAAGYKAIGLAEVLDISPATISRYENGKAPIPKLVELSARYVCEPVAPQSVEERLVSAIREVANG